MLENIDHMDHKQIYVDLVDHRIVQHVEGIHQQDV